MFTLFNYPKKTQRKGAKNLNWLAGIRSTSSKFFKSLISTLISADDVIVKQLLTKKQ